MDSAKQPSLPASSPASGAKAKPKTPTSTPGKTAKKRTASAKKAESDDDDEVTTSRKKAKTDTKAATSSPRQRKAPGKDPLKAMAMGKTFDLCADHDKMLIEWKEGGRTWEDIRKKWKEMTGDVTATSTLPNRYSRLKSNFVVIKEEHNALLIEAKQEVEASFEREKWHLIGKAMEAKGSDSYKPVELHRQYKNLLKMGAELKTERDTLIQQTPGATRKNGKKPVLTNYDAGDEMEED